MYLNITNRCTNRCVFCIRHFAEGLGTGSLKGGPEPDLEKLLEAVEAMGGAGAFEEIVWCGFGEPTFRLDLILQASPVFREKGAAVRLNTNGHGSLINGFDILPELSKAVDSVSVSLNAPTMERYVEICRPDPAMIPGGKITDEGAMWREVLDFLSNSKNHFQNVQATVVGHVLSAHEIEECRRLARDLGTGRFRVR